MPDFSYPSDFDRAYDLIQDDLAEVENRLRKTSEFPNPLIAEVSRYLFQKAGKRIRPALLTLSAKLCGYEDRDHVFWSSLIEMIHTASLIHDDIVDESEIRRGRDTVHARWGPNISVLLGDFLYIQSISQALRTKNYDIIDIVADATARMIEGELVEYSMAGNTDVSEDLYLDILEKKTASLFSACCRIGSVLGKADAKRKEDLAEFGRCLGLSFQIVDDLLDFKGQEETLGKPVLSDLREGRITLPLIHSLRTAASQDRDELIHLIRSRKSDRMSVSRARDIVISNGALDYAYDRAAAYSRKAKDILVAFPESAPRRALGLMAELILRRTK
jgi:octaprenyl-diphosphate synthase